MLPMESFLHKVCSWNTADLGNQSGFSYHLAKSVANISSMPAYCMLLFKMYFSVIFQQHGKQVRIKLNKFKVRLYLLAVLWPWTNHLPPPLTPHPRSLTHALRISFHFRSVFWGLNEIIQVKHLTQSICSININNGEDNTIITNNYCTFIICQVPCCAYTKTPHLILMANLIVTKCWVILSGATQGNQVRTASRPLLELGVYLMEL